MKTHVELSIVIPIYNSAKIFPELYKRLISALEHNIQSFEIIAVLDGCIDKSYDVISNFGLNDKRLKIIEFSRNFGHQAAISAGLEFASGDMVAIMDDDLEDPPENLPRFITKLNEGFDVVYGIRKNRKRSPVYRFLYSSFYRILDRLVDIKMPFDAGDFCVMRNKVVKALNNMPETNRYLRGMRTWTGFKQTGIEYEREERFAGLPGYNLRKYIALSLNGIFSFSYRPLKYVSIVGIVIALLSFLLGFRLIVLKFLDRIPDVPGWASLLVSVLFLSGLQLVSIGIIGEYISRIYDEVKKRPKYIIKSSLGFNLDDGNDRFEK